MLGRRTDADIRSRLCAPLCVQLCCPAASTSSASPAGQQQVAAAAAAAAVPPILPMTSATVAVGSSMSTAASSPPARSSASLPTSRRASLYEQAHVTASARCLSLSHRLNLPGLGPYALCLSPCPVCDERTALVLQLSLSRPLPGPLSGLSPCCPSALPLLVSSLLLFCSCSHTHRSLCCA